MDRVVDFQSEGSRTDEESSTDRTQHARNPTYDTGHRFNNNYPATTEEYQPPSYYTPEQILPNDWNRQDQSWNGQYVATTSSMYNASYYAPAMVPVTGITYDASYYSSDYTGLMPQGDHFSVTGDPRAYVGTGTTYGASNDVPANPSRRNAEDYHFCEPETDNP